MCFTGVMSCLQLLQGIVRPLQSAHQTSAIQRSRSAADIVLQAQHQTVTNNGNADHVIGDGSQFYSLPSALSKMTSVPTSGSTECSSSSVEEETAQVKKGLRHRKTERDTSSTTDAQKKVDLNENVITAGRVSQTVPGQGQSRENAALLSMKQSDDSKPLLSSTVSQNDSSDLTMNSLSSRKDGIDVGAGSTDSTSSRAGTRSWVSSSSYRQKLGSHAASRYQNVTSRLYGDDWFSSLSNRPSKKSATNTAELLSDQTSLKANSAVESLIAETTADSPTLSVSVSDTKPLLTDASSKPSLHFVYSCATSKSSTVERPSLTSDSGDDDDAADADNDEDNRDEDDDDEDDGDDEAGAVAEVGRFGLRPKRSDLMQRKDVVKWRRRLVASPPPRRAAHTPRRFEDTVKDLGTEAMQGRSVSKPVTLCLPDTASLESPKSPESSKHVSFDPFTLSLNAALEGELDVLQSLFTEVSLLCLIKFHFILKIH